MRSNLTVSLDHELKVRFKEYCYQIRKPQGAVLDTLISEMFEKEKAQSLPASTETGNAHGCEQ